VIFEKYCLSSFDTNSLLATAECGGFVGLVGGVSREVCVR